MRYPKFRKSGAPDSASGEHDKPADKKTLKQRIESNFMVILVVSCAAVGGAAVGASEWFNTQRIDTINAKHGLALEKQESTLKTDFDLQLVTLKASYGEEREKLRKKLARVKKERNKLRDLTGTDPKNVRCGGGQKCGHIRLEDMVALISDPDAMREKFAVEGFFDDRVFAMRDGEGARLVRTEFGANQRFLYNSLFDLDTISAPSGEEEYLWLLDDTRAVVEHKLFKRFAPFFAIYKMTPLEESGQPHRSRDLALDVFIRDFNDKFESARSLGMKMQVVGIRQEDTKLLAHFRTRLRNIRVGDKTYKKLFLNEMQLIVPVRGDGVYVVKCVFTSEKRDYRQSEHWVKVLSWWDTLRFSGI